MVDKTELWDKAVEDSMARLKADDLSMNASTLTGESLEKFINIMGFNPVSLSLEQTLKDLSSVTPDMPLATHTGSFLNGVEVVLLGEDITAFVNRYERKGYAYVYMPARMMGQLAACKDRSRSHGALYDRLSSAFSAELGLFVAELPVPIWALLRNDIQRIEAQLIVNELTPEKPDDSSVH